MKATFSALLALLLTASTVSSLPSAGQQRRALRRRMPGGARPHNFFDASARSVLAANSTTAASTAGAVQSRGPVSWDDKTVIIGGERIFVYSEEYHPYRNPGNPELWRDGLEKIKSAGFNTVSIYTWWGTISPSKGSASLESFNDLAQFLQIAKEVGIFVTLRPGPYINSETTNGGIAPWLQNEPGILRTDSPAYVDGQRPYLEAVVAAAKPFQLRAGSDGKLDPASGPIIMVQVENEYSESTDNDKYFADLKQFYIDNGITVPFSFNNCCTPANGAFADEVDFYGQDGYPLGFDCANPTNWGSGVQTGLYENFRKIKSTQPEFIPEYQGGSFASYGAVGGYPQCLELVNVNFARVYGQSLLSEGFRMQSYYMGEGGTSWGGVAYPGVYTSYDYAAGLSEERQVRDKHREYALTGGFWSAFPAFLGADRVANGAGTDIAGNDQSVFASKWAATDGTNQTFYVVRQTDSTSFNQKTFQMNVDTLTGQRTIPAQGSFTLNGRDSRLVAVNGKVSDKTTLLYSTAQPSFARTYGQTDVVVLHGDAGFAQEAVFASGDGTATFTFSQADGGSGVKADTSKAGEVRLNWTPSDHSASHVLLTAGSTRVLAILADTLHAYQTYFTPVAQLGTLENYAGTGELALVEGVYLVRNATISGSTLELHGATNQTSPLEIFTDPAVSAVKWNGQALQTSKTSYGSLKATAPGPSQEALKFSPPALSGWKVADSLPEIAKKPFDDSKWTSADQTTSNNEYFQDPVVQTQGKVLFADAYGYHANSIVWRGSFDATKNHGKGYAETGIYLHFEGGTYSAGSLWLNDKFVGTLNCDGTYSDAWNNFTFPEGALKNKNNVLTFLHDNTGLEEDGGYPTPIGFRKDQADANSKLALQTLKMPRGIIAYHLIGNNNTQVSWKLQGNKGGEQAPDKVRTYINEGGLYGEVQGWHLPGFDDSKWKSGAPSQGIQGAGVNFYRTTFNLNLPADHDIPISVQFSEDNGTDYRALLFVNGWQMGRRFTRWGPQTKFPVQPGVLNTNGENTIAVTLWNTKDEPAAISDIKLVVDGVYTGGIQRQANNPTYQQLRG